MPGLYFKHLPSFDVVSKKTVHVCLERLLKPLPFPTMSVYLLHHPKQDAASDPRQTQGGDASSRPVVQRCADMWGAAALLGSYVLVIFCKNVT